jgi:hypothetical protein
MLLAIGVPAITKVDTSFDFQHLEEIPEECGAGRSVPFREGFSHNRTPDLKKTVAGR